MNNHAFLNNLNAQQKSAVQHAKGTLLVLAGAGRGKTKVITQRFAYLNASHKVSPMSILAMTFTNKAANEMKERIEALTNKSSKRVWISTYHSIAARVHR